jgi:hypothetical protein
LEEADSCSTNDFEIIDSCSSEDFKEKFLLKMRFGRSRFMFSR